MSANQKRKVVQGLREMGFKDSDIGSAIQNVGYNVQKCAHFIMNNKSNNKQKLRPNMEVWVYSVDDEDWVPGHIVCITKQLVSVIFNGDDFRWFEKESDLFRTEDAKPEPLPNINKYQNNSDEYNDGTNEIENIEYTPPRPDEIDYYVKFTESVLGLELYSDEDGFNCIVGRCVSTIAKQKVTPGSQIVQVNDRWLANYRFEEIRDAVKQAARKPPLAVTFRIKKFLMRNGVNHQPNVAPQQQPNNSSNNNNGNVNGNSQQNIYGNNNNNNINGNNYDNSNNNIKVNKVNHSLSNQNNAYGSMEEEKAVRPSNENYIDMHNEILPSYTWETAQNLKINDQVDHRDDVGRFLLATILDIKYNKVKIHYEGWNAKWDSWCDLKKDLHRFAPPRSISRKANTRFKDLKIRDYVDINPLQRHKGWRVGQIRRMDKYSGQAQIVYKEDGQEFLYWAHLNNSQEIAPFMTKAAETIAAQHERNKLQKQKSQKQLNISPQEQLQQMQAQPSQYNNQSYGYDPNGNNEQHNHNQNEITDDSDTDNEHDLAFVQQQQALQQIQQQQQYGNNIIGNTQQQSSQSPHQQQLNQQQQYYQNNNIYDNIPPPPPNMMVNDKGNDYNKPLPGLPQKPHQKKISRSKTTELNQFVQMPQIPGPPMVGGSNGLTNIKPLPKQKKKRLPRLPRGRTGPLPTYQN